MPASLLKNRVKIKTPVSWFCGLRGVVVEDNRRIDSVMVRFTEEELRRVKDFDRVKAALNKPVHFLHKEVIRLVPKV